MRTAYRVPRNLFGPSGFESQDNEQTSPITDIKVNSLVIAPAAGTTLRASEPAEISGYAWDGGSGIRRVEVSTDAGVSWRDASLQRSLGRYAWTPWRFALASPASGIVSLRVRATANDGSTQPDALVRNPAGYHHNVVQAVEYRAT